MAFYLAKIPVIHFFTGPHLDYHRTTDTADKINATGGVQVSEVIAAIALRTASPKQPLHYQKATSQPALGLVHGKQKKSKGAYLGTIPDYSTLVSPQGPAQGGSPGGGVKLAGTRPGSPADRAGVQAEDELVSIGNQTIKTLQDFTLILSELDPGTTVTLGIRRKGKLLHLKAVIGKRKSSSLP
jgi:S1-C subfamily serine protease